MTIRRAAPADAGAVASVYLRARRAAEPAIPPLVHGDDEVRGWIAGQIAAAPERGIEVWLAVTGNDAVGMMVTSSGWLDQLYVEPGRIGEGIGSRLLDHAKDRAGADLQLWTFEANLGARRFYERHGFVEVERTDGSGNEEGAPDVRCVWRRRD